jgi:membrane protein
MAEVERNKQPTDARRPSRLLAPFSALRALGRIAHDAANGLLRHDGVMVATAIAFSLTFALFPFAIFVIALGARLGGPDLSALISEEALNVLPEQVIAALEPELERLFAPAESARPLTFGLIVTLVSITGAVEAIRDGLNRAYRCTEERGILRRYAGSLAFVFVAMVFLLVVSALGLGMPVLLDLAHRYWRQYAFEVRLLETAREALLVLVTAAMLYAMHRILPARRRRSLEIGWGILVTLAGWWLAAKLFGLYISRIANYSATYAGLAGIVTLMFFLYIQALIFVYGAEFNRAVADHRRLQPPHT